MLNIGTFSLTLPRHLKESLLPASLETGFSTFTQNSKLGMLFFMQNVVNWVCRSVLGSALIFLSSLPSGAATLIALDLEGVTGSLDIEPYVGLIEVKSFKWGASSDLSPGDGPGPGELNVLELELEKSIDISSPALLTSLANGTVHSTAVLYVLEPNSTGANSLTMTFFIRPVVITKLELEDNFGGFSTEKICLRFTNMEFTYDPVGPGASVTGDIAAP